MHTNNDMLTCPHCGEVSRYVVTSNKRRQIVSCEKCSSTFAADLSEGKFTGRVHDIKPILADFLLNRPAVNVEGKLKEDEAKEQDVGLELPSSEITLTVRTSINFPGISDEHPRIVEEWTEGIEYWEAIKTHAAQIGILPIEIMFDETNEELRSIASNPPGCSAAVFENRPEIHELIRKIFECPDFAFQSSSAMPLLLHFPGYFEGENSPPTVLSSMASDGIGRDTQKFFCLRYYSSSQAIAVRHTERVLTALNNVTGETVHCWADPPIAHVVKILALEDAANFLNLIKNRFSNQLFFCNDSGDILIME